MDYKLPDAQADNQCNSSDIIESSEKNKVVNQRKRKSRNVELTSKLLCGDILHKRSLGHASPLPSQQLQPISSPLVEKQAISETQYEEFPESFNLWTNQVQPTSTAIENALQTFIPEQQFVESSDVFEKTLASQLRQRETVENTLQIFNPEQMFEETSDITELEFPLLIRPASVLTHASDSSEWSLTQGGHTNSQIVSNSDSCQLTRIQEQLAVQNFRTTRVIEEHHNQSTQFRQLETYLKNKMENLDQGIFLIMNTLNSMKHGERQINFNDAGEREHDYLEMPKLPITKQENVILLNYALRHCDYMNKFMTQLSPHVKIHKSSTRKSIYSIMSKMFSLNLLLNYTWGGSENTFAKASSPFSSLDGILKFINHMLGRYSTGIEIEKELRELLQCVPRIYCDVLKKQQKDKMKDQ